MSGPMSEDDLLTAITDAASLFGWRWHHVRRSDRALQMGHTGFPDLVLARKGRVIFAELKREKGQPTQDQWAWMHELTMPMEAMERYAGLQVTTHTWRPSDLDAVLEILR